MIIMFMVINWKAQANVFKEASSLIHNTRLAGILACAYKSPVLKRMVGMGLLEKALSEAVIGKIRLNEPLLSAGKNFRLTRKLDYQFRRSYGE